MDRKGIHYLFDPHTFSLIRVLITQMTTQEPQNEIRRNIQRASWLMMGSIIISRVIGFFREWILARTVGASAMTDVYYASFTIPDFLNYLLAAGALSISFIPILSGYLLEGKIELGQKVFRSLSTLMGGFLIVLIIVGEIFARDLGQLIAPGFSPAQLDTMTYLLRIILPAQFFFYWGGLAISVQQAHGKFLLPAIAPILYNAGIIVCGVALYQTHGVTGFSVGVLVGSIVGQGLVQWWGIRKLGFSARPSFDFSPEIWAAIKRYFYLTFPIMLGFSVVVTDEWFSKYFASTMEHRALSWMSYARTEMRIPVAILGQAAGIASFPYLSRLWSQKAYADYGKTLLREIQKLWAAAPLATVILIVHALPITHFIYGGSRMTTVDLDNTASALQMFGIGVFFWTAQVLLSRGFYACQKTWLPSVVGTVISFVSIPVYQRLGAKYGFRGLALAGSIAIAIYTIILWILLRQHLRRHAPDLKFGSFFTFIGLWAGVTAVLGYGSYAIYGFGIYRGTQVTALLDVIVTVGILVPLAILLLRKVFARLTDGALF